jgi:hypothetical protein
MHMARDSNADALARLHTERAIEVMAECLEVFDPRVALDAAKALLDRGHGKPLTAVIAVPAGRRLQQQVAAMTTEALMNVIDAEYEDVPVLPPPAERDPLLE